MHSFLHLTVWFLPLVWHLYWDSINSRKEIIVFILVAFWKLDSLKNKFKTADSYSLAADLIGLLFASIWKPDSTFVTHPWTSENTSAFVWCFPSAKRMHRILKYCYDTFTFYLISMDNFFLTQSPLLLTYFSHMLTPRFKSYRLPRVK